MKRRDNIKRMKALMDELRKGKKKPSKKKESKKKKEEKKSKVDADVNKDGKVDEKDLSIVKKIVKQDED